MINLIFRFLMERFQDHDNIKLTHTTPGLKMIALEFSQWLRGPVKQLHHSIVC